MSAKQEKPMSNPFFKKPVADPAPSPAPAEVDQIESEDVGEKAKPKGIMFRVMPADWHRVKRYAETREKSVQEILEIAFNMLLKSEGLEPIDGIPRDKSRK